MIGNLKPYPAMKPSGVPWLGDVPEHWEVRRLGTSVQGCINGTWGSEPNGHQDLPCVRVADFDRTRHRVRITNPTLRAISPSERNRRLLRSGDLLLEKSGGGDLQPVGVVMLYDHDAEAVCSNFVARMPVAAGFDSAYLTYLHSHLYAIRLNVRSIKQTTGIQNLDSSSYLSESVTLPPLPEQAAIVRFLDHADRRIRRYIRAKQKLIKLLEEQKQAIIHRAVTRGLDPNVRLKPSGVEWLGDVPEHWVLVPNRAMLRRRKALVGDRHSEYELLSLTKAGVIVRDVSTGRGKFSADMGSSQEVRVGDLIFCLFDVPETPRTVGLSQHNGMITGAYTVFECRDSQLARFLEAFYIAMDDRKLLGPLYSGLRNTIPPSIFLGIKSPVPPLPEQAAIIRFLDEATAGIAGTIDRARREIDLLREYRTSLIADVVTGKRDVREAAARFP